VPPTCHMPRQSHPYKFDQPNNTYGTLWTMDLLGMQVFQSSVTYTLLTPNTFPSTLFSNTLCLCSFFSVRDQVSHPYKTTGKIIVLCILMFMWIPNWKSKHSAPNVSRRGRIRKQLLDDLKETRGWWTWKDEALDLSLWRTGFGRGCGPFERQTAEWINE
jgi:hypothetical protein